MSEEVKRFDVLWSPGGYQLVPGDELVRSDDYAALRAKLVKAINEINMLDEWHTSDEVKERLERVYEIRLRRTGAGFEEDTGNG